MLRDSVVVVVAVVRTRPRAIPLAMITMRKSTHGFLFLSYMSMELCPSGPRSSAIIKFVDCFATRVSVLLMFRNLYAFESTDQICKQFIKFK